MNQQDRELIQQLIEGFNQQLELKYAISERHQKRSTALSKARQWDAKKIQEEESEKSRRHKFWSIVIGVVAVIAGGWIAQIIISMSSDMNTMAEKMTGMAVNMQTMADNMTAMTGHMTTMSSNMNTMSGDMATMASDMHIMQKQVTAMTGSVGTMSKDVGSMSHSVRGMQFDTAVMRNGVSGMANDTGAMGHPFRLMNSVAPW